MTPQETPSKALASEESKTPEGITEGIWESIRAYRAALPALLQDPKMLGKCIAFNREKRLGIADGMDELYQVCSKMGLAEDECFVGPILPTGLEEEEEIDESLFEYDDEQYEDSSS